VHCTPEGIVQAQANHTRTLGSKAAFAAANPQFDGEWFEEVTASVATCREVAAAEEPAAGPGTLDAPISCADIYDALLTLKNGTASSPVSRIPNKLLKYSGGAMAGILKALFAAVWASGKPPQAWLHGTIQYIH
jgi:hypothetical protein